MMIVILSTKQSFTSPRIMNYTFANGTKRVRFFTFGGQYFKAIFVICDILHISLSIYLSALADSDPIGLEICHKEFSAYYAFGYMMLVTGFIFIARLVYTIFPHILGPLYFARRQRLDQLTKKGEEKLLPMFPYSVEYYMKKDKYQKNFVKCNVCMKNYSQEDEIVELLCTDKHIMHHKCGEVWFND